MWLLSGQRRLHCDFGRLEVSNFTCQDDIWVLPQECAKDGREMEPDLIFHNCTWFMPGS
jgi:hypothetical protein